MPQRQIYLPLWLSRTDDTLCKAIFRGALLEIFFVVMGCMVKKYLMALFLCAFVIVHAESFADESEIASDASLVENNATATFGADGNGTLLVDGNIKKIEAKNTALSKKI